MSKSASEASSSGRPQKTKKAKAQFGNYFIHIFRTSDENREISPSTPRRDSLGNIQTFIKTLAYWKKQPSTKKTSNATNNNNNTEELKPPTKSNSKVERSRSFSIKCDKGYSTYYQIEPRKLQPSSPTSEAVETASQMEAPMAYQYHPHHPPPSHRKFSNIHQVGLPLQPPIKRY